MMTTKRIYSIFKPVVLALSLVAFLASCNKETEDPTETSKYTMGDTKNDSPQGSRCYMISQFTEQGEDQAITYSDIVWEFRNNETFIIRSFAQEWPGTWDIFNQGTQLSLTQPDNDSLPPQIEALTGIWTIESLNPNNPLFIDDDGDILELSQTACNFISPDLEVFTTNLLDSLWKIEEFIFQGNDGTSNFNNVEFDFKPNGILTLMRNSQQRNGLWNASEDEDGISLTLQFDSQSAVLDALSREWSLFSMDASTTEFVSANGPPSQGYTTFTLTK